MCISHGQQKKYFGPVREKKISAELRHGTSAPQVHGATNSPAHIFQTLLGTKVAQITFVSQMVTSRD